MGLELCMACLYPQWLRIKAFHEFLEVSAFGHVVYGTVLGILTGLLLQKAKTNKAEQAS